MDKKALIISALGAAVVTLLLLPKDSMAEEQPHSAELDVLTNMGFSDIVENETLRRCDIRGCGHYHANRGSRLHEGIDIVVMPNQRVYAGINGYVKRFLNVYADDPRYVGIEVQGTGVHEAYRLKYFYVKGILKAGATVNPKTAIGVAQNIAEKYAGITPHVHIELYKNGVQIDPTPYIAS